MARSARKVGSPDGRRRVIIEEVSPEINCGRFPAKRVVGESVRVEADVFTDGHDSIAARILYRSDHHDEWSTSPLLPLVNDRWAGSFPVEELGFYTFTIEAWVDHFATWRRDLGKRVEAGQDVGLELLVGAGFIERAARRARGDDGKVLREICKHLRDDSVDMLERARVALEPSLAERMRQWPDLRYATRYDREPQIQVDPQRARFSSWYEMFPRSASATPGRHGTFADVEARLPYIAEMGFDVLYLPPIHPIGHTKRKGKNNALTAEPGDPGSPWAIGGPEGGHKGIHPELGTPDDFRRLVKAARGRGIELALDIAFQCAPDHPWVEEHPDWFRHRPDGSIQYAENPPKKYEDIYPFDFENDDWKGLWDELTDVVRHWVAQGVRVFRVDNPHTKPLRFWEYLIRTIKEESPEVIFLAEAFTRPKVMYHLAKLGFNQSYNYFPWRNLKWEIEQYFTELTQTQVVEYFRPNLWPNTPDILTEFLQHGGRPAFLIRLALAATLGASYGIYGPAFELQEHVARNPGSEEYLHSEKYEIRHWDVEAPHSLRNIIARLNAARRENAALRQDRTLRFHPTDNDEIICYSKTDEARENIVLCVVNLSPYHTHAGWVNLQLDELGLLPDQGYQVHDLLTDARYLWNGAHNYVELHPHVLPMHVFRVVKQVRHEQDFEYYSA